MSARLRVRHVLVDDGVRAVPGWYVVDTSYRPARTVHGPTTRDAAWAMLERLALSGPKTVTIRGLR